MSDITSLTYVLRMDVGNGQSEFVNLARPKRYVKSSHWEFPGPHIRIHVLFIIYITPQTVANRNFVMAD